MSKLEKLELIHRKAVYTFKGGALPIPAPGTYDATAWTPPTHRIYVVDVFSDGMWSLSVNGAMIKSGAGGASSVAFARSMVELYAPEFNQ